MIKEKLLGGRRGQEGGGVKAGKVEAEGKRGQGKSGCQGVGLRQLLGPGVRGNFQGGGGNIHL